MKSKMHTIILMSIIFLQALSSRADTDNRKLFQEARTLERNGKHKEAFSAYIGIPGAEYVAVTIARPKAEEYLSLLKSPPTNALPQIVNVVMGDLLIAVGQKKEALKAYRAVITGIGTNPEHGWTNGLAPMTYYPVEPTQSIHRDISMTQPFSIGPGSHRDNWLIRRFIALNAINDTANEFARVWEIHKHNTQPYIASRTMSRTTNEVERIDYLVTPAGYTGHALQFAIDYAYFLKQHKSKDSALEILLSTLIQIDMDINPNISHPENWQPASQEDSAKRPRRYAYYGRPRLIYRGCSAGISRKEFIRLAYGEFKAAEKEKVLIEKLQDEIDQNSNPARRLLARVRMHQGMIEEAIELELKYIQEAGFTPYTATYRCGRVYEESHKPAEAAREYETFLEMPEEATVTLPDADEEATLNAMMSQAIQIRRPGGKSPGSTLRTDAAKRLTRIYSSLGKTDKTLDNVLRELDTNKTALEKVSVLEAAAERFRVANKKDVFDEWLRRKSSEAESSMARASLYWMLGKPGKSAEALAESLQGKAHNQWSLHAWKDRFSKKDNLIILLKAIVKANPSDARARLELLDAEDSFEGEEVMKTLELLLNTDASFAFARGKGVYNRTRFRNYYDLAYRLMRMHEKAGDKDKLRQLGLRIAKGDKPFQEWWKIDQRQYEYRDHNDLPQDLNACLALTVQHAEMNELKIIKAVWNDIPDFPAKRQLLRRISGGISMHSDLKGFNWANAPSKTKIIASLNNVLCLARDDQYIYAGHPWGIAVYDFSGEGVTRVALGQAVNAIAAADGNIWAGAAKGLYRIKRGNWKIAHLWLHGDVPEKNRHARSFPDNPKSYSFDNAVNTMTLDGDDLWLGTHRNIQRLNIPSMLLRAYSYGELKLSSWGGFERILPKKDYVWANGNYGVRRYDRKTGKWDSITYGEHPVHLIDIIDGRVFVDIYINNKLRHRPAIVDRNTLKLTPLLIEGPIDNSNRCLNQVISCYGKHNGQLVFGAGYPSFKLDESNNKLRFVGMPWDRRNDSLTLQTDIPADLRSGTPRRTHEGGIICDDDSTHRHTLFGKPFHAGGWMLLPLPDGGMVLGGRHSRSSLDSQSEPHSTASGGLMLINSKGVIRKISDDTYDNTILGEAVFGVTPDPDGKRTWLCTDTGIALLDSMDRVIACLTEDDGLFANRITSGVSIGEKLYFSSSWGDSGGGIGMFDPGANVFTSFGESDGLSADKVLKILVKGRGLLVTYDIERGNFGDIRWRLFPPDTFDPANPKQPRNRTPRTFTDREHQKHIHDLHGRTSVKMHLLGGKVLSETSLNGKQYVAGAHGIIVVDSLKSPSLEIEELHAKVIIDPSTELIRAAVKRPVTLDSVESFEKYMKDDNPYFRANVIGKLMGNRILKTDNCLPLLRKQLTDPELRVRTTTLFVIARAGKSAEIIPSLKNLLNDPDLYIRAFCTLELCKFGILPNMENLIEMQKKSSWGNFPFGAKSSVGVVIDMNKLYTALAPYAEKEHFEFMLKHPVTSDDYEPRLKIFNALGKSLVRHPEVADVLLLAYTKERDPGPKSNYGAARFAQKVFKMAGPPILPRLHEALKSKNRVIRSNAARACGAIKDPSSRSPLINALDLESGLSRASIVWALGELKANEALPKLAELYIDARNDEKRRAGSGFRGAQSGASIQSSYNSFRNLDSIGSEWNEVKDAARPTPIDPIANEWLITTAIIFEAIRKIGPDASQEFYRKLAGEKDVEARQEAAVGLSGGNESDHKKNLPILRNMLADKDHQVRIRSAVSLLIIDDKSGKHTITQYLKGTKWEKRHAVEQLKRVKDLTKRDFAKALITAIAEDPSLQNYSDKYLVSMAKELLKP